MFDIAIIGGGIGGYTAAIKAAKEGLKVALFEKDKLGGTCLHEGCIPTKTFLQLSNKYQDVYKLQKMGFGQLQIPEIATLDWSQFLQYKNQVVNQLFQGVQYLIQKNKIQLFPKKVTAISKAGPFSISTADRVVQAKHVILATGSKPIVPLNVHKKYSNVLSSDQLLSLHELPKSIVIVGSGVIGIEFATFFSQLNIPVTIVEKEETILGAVDSEIAQHLKQSLTRKGVQFKTGCEVLFNQIEESENEVTLKLRQGAEILEEKAQYVLVAIGRKGHYGDIDFSSLKKENEQFPVDKYLKTKVSNLYIIGDASGNVQLAHAAAYQAEIVIQRILGHEVNSYDELLVPKCIYSVPEVSSIGFTEREAKESYEVKVGKFQLNANGKSLITGETEGFIKVIADKATDRILGVHIIGDKATELISEGSLAMLFEATASEIGMTVHPHPTVSEIFNEAALAVDGKEIHS
ncbi:dihydrolipoyl dehydrogenase [Metasolibacillus fluoroglycofenilyticus]|uniref:dihydrolipoyl dehydrogenase n=1 Tax=Metasolibacillus fluoroglycofenilyticus TaxID=1239396 RepID=UPI000D3B9803|nr:dihydrolipoyl dehydrogenase [Metasolibacillus fluoroglycofenilyticus]